MTPDAPPLIRAVGVRRSYGSGALETPVLFGVSLEVLGGQLALLRGPSGSGKTTLISILAGLRRPSAGRVELRGRPISEMTEAQVAHVRREHLGFVFQESNLFPALTARDNVAEVLAMKGAPLAQARARADVVLSQVGLGDRLEHRPAELSSGQRQRVAIARALAGEPEVLIGDEPTAALDGANALAMMALVRAHIRPDRAALIVTHDLRLARYADRVIELQDGRIVRDERPDREAAVES